MSCNDKDGKPDLAEAANRQKRYGGYYSQPSFQGNNGGSRQIAQAEYENLDLGNPYMSEEEMAAFTKEFLR